MATAKRKKKTAKRPARATSSLLEVRKAMAGGKDIIPVSGTLKRPEVRIPDEALHAPDHNWWTTAEREDLLEAMARTIDVLRTG